MSYTDAKNAAVGDMVCAHRTEEALMRSILGDAEDEPMLKIARLLEDADEGDEADKAAARYAIGEIVEDVVAGWLSENYPDEWNGDEPEPYEDPFNNPAYDLIAADRRRA